MDLAVVATLFPEENAHGSHDPVDLHLGRGDGSSLRLASPKPRAPVSCLFGSGRLLSEVTRCDAARGELSVSREVPFNTSVLRGTWEVSLTPAS